MILDIILILIIISGFKIGYKKGIVKSLLSLGTSILSYLFSIILYRYISHFLMSEKGWRDAIRDTLIEKNLIDFDDMTTNLTANMVETNELLSKLPQNVKDAILNAVTEKTNLNVIIYTTIAEYLTYIIVFVGMVFLFKIVLSLIVKFTNWTFKLPLFKQANKYLGGVIYAFNYFLLGFVIVSLIQVILIAFDVTLLGSSQIVAYIHNLFV